MEPWQQNVQCTITNSSEDHPVRGDDDDVHFNILYQINSDTVKSNSFIYSYLYMALLKRI